MHGASTGGLGLDAGLACFLDAYGEPDAVDLVHDGEHWQPTYVAWEDTPIAVGWDPTDGAWDGTPSWMYVRGE